VEPNLKNGRAHDLGNRTSKKTERESGKSQSRVFF